MHVRNIRRFIVVFSILISFCIVFCKCMAKTINERNLKTGGRFDRKGGETGYFLHEDITATYFYVGEYKITDRLILDNRSSAWTGNWVGSYGTVDHPEKRNGYFPEGSIPKENPFYCALPYNDLTADGYKEHVWAVIPWSDDAGRQMPEWPYSYCKNRWIKIVYNGRMCYAQWEDVGPFETDDWQYVFGDSAPRNPHNNGAGLDISPACFSCLGMTENDTVSWQFVEFCDVPHGPWKEIITTSQPYWN